MDGPDFDPGDLSSKREWVKIGSGSFGNVYKANLLGTAVAVKEIGNSRPDRVAGLHRDMFYLRKFPHPNVVQVFGAFTENKVLYMVRVGAFTESRRLFTCPVWSAVSRSLPLQ